MTRLRVVRRVAESANGLVRDAYDARIILKKTPDGGWYVLTGFPR